MKQLPKGVYAVYKPIKYGETVVHFRDEAYEIIPGVNGFYCFEELVRSEMVAVEESFLGYENMAVVIVPAGVLPVGDWGKTTQDRFRAFFPMATAILGENAGISPNEKDLRTPAPRREESVLQGSFYFGNLCIKDNVDGGLIVDGVTLNCRFHDQRNGGENAYHILKNSIITPAVSVSVVYATADFVGKRQITISDCRSVGMESMNSDGNLFCVCQGDVLVERTYMAQTEKFIGMTNYTRSQVNRIDSLTMKDCLFEDNNSLHGLVLALPEDSRANITLENCQFLNATAETSPVVELTLPETASMQVTNCHFAGNPLTEAMVLGGKAPTVENCSFVGFSAPFGAGKTKRTQICEDTVYPITDAHEAVEADFSALEKLYAGKQCFHGDFHCHSNSGGTSDGQTPIENYVEGMKKLHMDFAAIVDHRQMRHFFLPVWDEQYMICGTEPTCVLDEPELPQHQRKMDYTMIFPDKEGLAKVLEKFPNFGYTGGTEGTYIYYNHTREELREIGEYIYSIGGLMSHAHPKQLMACKDPLRYYFGDHVAIETIHGFPAGLGTRHNHRLWVSLLNLGKRVKTHGSSDSHGPVSNSGQTTLYCEKHHATDIFNTVRSGNCTAGAVGIQMSIGDVAMGGVATYEEGQTLLVKVQDFHQDRIRENTVYSARVYTDQGLAWVREFDGKALQVALPVQKRMYYRVEIYNETDDHIEALGNPIWLD